MTGSETGKAEADALRKAADALDAWHSENIEGDRWDNGFIHAADMLRDRADELDPKPGRWHVEADNGTYYVACADYAIETVYETFEAARAKADELKKEEDQ